MGAEATIRLRNVNSGAVVSIREEKVERMGSEWVPADQPEPSGSTGYADMKAAELKAEIAKRNADREDDDQVPLTGNKAALVAVLEAADAANEDGEDGEGSTESDESDESEN